MTHKYNKKNSIVLLYRTLLSLELSSMISLSRFVSSLMPAYSDTIHEAVFVSTKFKQFQVEILHKSREFIHDSFWTIDFFSHLLSNYCSRLYFFTIFSKPKFRLQMKYQTHDLFNWWRNDETANLQWYVILRFLLDDIRIVIEILRRFTYFIEFILDKKQKKRLKDTLFVACRLKIL